MFAAAAQKLIHLGFGREPILALVSGLEAAALGPVVSALRDQRFARFGRDDGFHEPQRIEFCGSDSYLFIYSASVSRSP